MMKCNFYWVHMNHPSFYIQSRFPLTHLNFSPVVFKLAFLGIPEYSKCLIKERLHQWTFHWCHCQTMQELNEEKITFGLSRAYSRVGCFVHALGQLFLEFDIFRCFFTHLPTVIWLLINIFLWILEINFTSYYPLLCKLDKPHPITSSFSSLLSSSPSSPHLPLSIPLLFAAGPSFLLPESATKTTITWQFALYWELCCNYKTLSMDVNLYRSNEINKHRHISHNAWVMLGKICKDYRIYFCLLEGVSLGLGLVIVFRRYVDFRSEIMNCEREEELSWEEW